MKLAESYYIHADSGCQHTQKGLNHPQYNERLAHRSDTCLCEPFTIKHAQGLLVKLTLQPSCKYLLLVAQQLCYFSTAVLV